MLHRREFVLRSACAAALGNVARPALATNPGQPALNKTARFVLGFPAGGSLDSIARLLAERIKGAYAPVVLVENRAGGAGRIAMDLVKAAEPDGSTIVMAPASVMVIYPHVYKRLSYDPFKDFAPVAHLSNFQIGLGVSANVPAKTLREYVAWVKADPKNNGYYASAAAGSIPHFFGVMFAKTAGIELTHVPYKGTAAAMTAVAGGEVSAISTVAADIRALVTGGKARLLAVAGEQRDASFPEVPTFRELGYDLVAKPWYGLFAPAGTPPERVAYLAQAVAQAMKSPNVIAKIQAGGSQPVGSAPDAFGKRLQQDTAYWADMVKVAGVSVD